MGAVKNAITEVGASGINLLETLKYIARGKISVGDTSIQMIKAGIGSLFIVIITTGFIGLAIASQLAREFEKFGAEQFLGGLIAVATVRELAPVITSIVVTGRVGAAIAAEIGSMKTSEQIDALSVLGINPIKYLLVPRLIATSLASPLLTIIAAFISIVAGMFLANMIIDLNYTVYLNAVRQFLQLKDVLVMMLKAVIFGATIAVIATTTGFEVTGGAEAVGEAATKTVVRCIILIFFFNYVITSVFF